MVTDRESNSVTIREPRVMAVGVNLKILSNGTTGTVDSIWLRFVKVILPSVNQRPAMTVGVPSKYCRMVPVVPLVRYT